MKHRAVLFVTIAMFLLLSLVPGTVSAHRLYVDVTGTTARTEVEIEAYYGDGKPVRNGDVTVLDQEEDVITKGKTDDDGKFTFFLNESKTSQNITIEVEQTGHIGKAEIELQTNGLVIAEKDEDGLPLYARVIAGFGYLLGLAGIASLYISRRKDLQRKEMK